MRISYIVVIVLFPLLLGISAPKGPTDLGNEAFGAGRYDEALELYREAAEADPDSPQAHYNLGNAYYKLGNYKAARSEYRRAAELDPMMADAYYNSGDAGFRLKDFEGALEDYEHSDRLRPHDPDTLFNIELVKKILEEMEKKSGSGEGEGEGKGKSEGEDGDSDNGGDGGLGVGKQEVEKLSEDAVESMLERQSAEEKKLRGYFKPGRNQDATGMPGEAVKQPPERDW